MYGRDEHRYALRRIGDVTRELDRLADAVSALVDDLQDDDAAGTTKARGYLTTATQRIASALGQCDLAVQHLPTPVAR
jgi:phage host-nuclease inhibitor protein Gam